MAHPLIFITGVTGFIGSQVLQDVLESGHRARVSVRQESQIDEVKARYPKHNSHISFVVISSLDDERALRAALDGGVEYIFHIASPMPGKGEDFETEYVHPAVEGTLSVLRAAAGVASVKRVVVVSSVLALMPLDGLAIPGFHITEGTNPPLPSPLSFPPGPAGYGPKYSASKILAHRATLAWLSQTNPSFSLVTIHPTFVLGRDLTQVDPTPKGINAFLIRSLATSPPGKPAIPASFVDVRDVSATIIRALDLNVQVGKSVEVLVAGEPTSWEEVARFVREKYPEVQANLEGSFQAPFTVDTTRAEREMGVRWRGVREILASVFDQQREMKRRGSL